MKILYIYQFLSYGGVEMLLRNRAKYLKQLDSNSEINLLVMKSSVTDIPSEFDNVYISKNKTDIKNLIDSHDLIINVDTPELFNIIEKSNKPLVLECFSSAKASRKYLKSNLPSNLRLVIVPSKTFKKIVEEEISNKQVPIEVIYNIIDRKTANDRQIDINLREIRPILWVGRLEESKGWRDALEIIRLFKEINISSNFELFIIGEVTDKYDKHIFEIMDDLGVLGDVRYIPKVDFKDMNEIYSLVAKNKGIFLSTSKMETFGLSVLEAMSNGLPCVLNDLEIFKELYDKASYLYKDEKDASEYINKILTDDDLYRSLQQKAIERSKEFEQEKIIPVLYNLYKDVIIDEKRNQ